MQWSTANNAGFSTAPRDKLVLPVIDDGEFGYRSVNVAAQERDRNSFLNWLERMTRLRMKLPEFGTAACEWLESSEPAVLAHRCSGEKASVFAVHNLSARELDVTVKTACHSARLLDLLHNCEHNVAEDGGLQLHMEPYAYLWLREERNPDSLV
jgi:maltose alpha-D-glucosyltransferase/alpha-amylase